MLVTYSDRHRDHSPRSVIYRGVAADYMEIVERADVLIGAVRERGHEVKAPRDFGLAPLAAVHTPDYISFLQSAHANWQRLIVPTANAAPNVVGNTFAVRQLDQRPSSFQGQIGYYLAGSSVPIHERTFDAAVSSAHVALEAAEAISSGAREAYALCRPPGHHAYADIAGGFCYFNNAAIAAHRLAGQTGRVAILDVDVHHGNGTQGIFYERSDVFFVSVHADPNHAYPFYAGYPQQRGNGAGLGYNLNLPLPLGTGDQPFLAAIESGLDAIRTFDPSVLLISLGFDAFTDDPQKLLRVTTAGFHQAGRAIGAVKQPVLLVQEGGYAVDQLGVNLNAFLDGFLAQRS
jgi:acetoin utilization deacetylase AcuC-like enzyme